MRFAAILFWVAALVVGTAFVASVFAVRHAAAVEVDPAVLEAQAKRAAVMAEACSKTIAIFPPEGQGGGSGVLISADGYALSNFHVVVGSEKHMKCGLSDGKAYDAVIVGIDPVGDVALIKLLGRDDFPFAEFGDSDELKVGDWVFCAGNPFLLAHDFQPTVTYGIVSGVHRYQYPSGTLLEYADCIQTDASINPGNSGGPLWTSEGKLIGINGRGSFEKRGRVNVGVGYAISINQIKHFLGSLKSGRIVDHATLGARIASDSDGRPVVADVLEDSDAWRRGLRIGDEIVSFGGRPVLTTNAFKNVLGIFPQGYRVPLIYRNRGKTLGTYVRLPGVHHPEELLEKMRGAEMPKEQMPPTPEPDAPGEDRPQEGKPDDKKQPPKSLIPKFRLPFGADEEKSDEPKVPEAVAKLFVERRGYANYYFNTVERDRVWAALSARFGKSTADDAWSIQADEGAATVGAKTPVDISIDATRVEYRLPTGAAVLPVGDDLTTAFEPVGSGGMLAALSFWRRLMTLGPEKFGDLTYLGTFPLPDSPDVYDVLLGRHAGATCRYFVHPASGDLTCVELLLNEEVDPCELVLLDYREQAGRWLPGRIEVRHGDSVYAVVVPRNWNLSAEVKP